MLKQLLTCALLLSSVLSTWGQMPNLVQNADRRACRQWVDSVYNSMTDRQRVAQLMCPKIVPTRGQESRSAVFKLVRKLQVGFLLYTAGSIDQFADITNFAQENSDIPVLITLDGEWGLAMRVSDTPKYPCNMALGAIANDTLLYRYGQDVARQCRIMGIQVNFAPVIDVNSNAANPVIGYRSFGEDPHRVARLGYAFARGLEDGGVQAVGKHFPGHGDTSTDSHKALPVVEHSRARLDSVDLLPFQTFIDGGISGIMTGHICVPTLDASGLPASLSPLITTDVLRRQMGFRGLIYTDALGMRGAQASGRNASLAALLAGADVLETSDAATDIDAIILAMQRGTVTPRMIEEHCKRVLTYKYVLGLTDLQPVNTDNLHDRLWPAETDALLTDLANASVTVLRNEDNVLPIGNLATARIAIVNTSKVPYSEFADICAKYTKVDVYSPSEMGGFSVSTLNEIRNHDVVLALVYDDKMGSRNTFGQLADMPGLVGVFMVNPYKMAKFKGAFGNMKALVLGYDNLPCIRRATAMAVFGGIEVSGTLPVNLRGLARLGDGIHLPQTRLGYSSPVGEDMDVNLGATVDSLVNEAMARGAFPGCQVLVARNGNVVLERAYGRLTADGAAVTTSTVYDLASVSKTIGTLPGVMKLYDLGLIDLDAPVSRYIAALRPTDKADITVRQLLFHESGIQPSLNMYNVMMDTTTYTGKLITNRRDADHSIFVMKNAWGHNTASLRTDIQRAERSDAFNIEAARGIWVGQAAYDTIMARIYTSPLRANKKYRYSCLNFCLLMDMEQNITGLPHQQFVTDSIWAPLGAMTIGYRPTERLPLSQIAPTEKDTYLRRQHVHGFVHDETAAFLGGVSGNAGVFANASDVAKVCQMWLNGGLYGDARVLSETTVRTFTTTKSPTCRRGLGFDKPDVTNANNSPLCEGAPASVFGHTGFTGTCFWVDPDHNLIFVFLSNSVNPTRDNTAFNGFRANLFDTVLHSIQ